MKTGRCPKCKKIKITVKHCTHNGLHRFAESRHLCPMPEQVIREHGCGKGLLPIKGSGQEASYRPLPTTLKAVGSK